MKSLNELSAGGSDVQPSPRGALKIDDLFFGARRQLKDAQKKLMELLEILQDGNNGVDASEVADLIKATASAVSAMDSMAHDWQQKAAESQQKIETFDVSTYVKGQLFHEQAKTLEDLRRETVFDFDRLLGDVGIE